MPSRFDREKAEGNLKAILDRLYNDTDLAVLGEYRKLYKKEISLFRRSWAAAWLFMYYDQRETPKLLNNKKHSRPEGKAGPAEELSSKKTCFPRKTCFLKKTDPPPLQPPLAKKNQSGFLSASGKTAGFSPGR